MTSPVRGARAIHFISAMWTFGLAVLVFSDVMGRSLFSSPIPGTREIVQNSIVAITFLQLPLAIYTGSMLRTSILADAVPAFMRRILRIFASLLGLAVFVGLVLGTYESFYEAYLIGEYEGEGALRVPTWPVRGIVLVMSVFGAFAYLSLIIYDIQGRLIKENAAPGSI